MPIDRAAYKKLKKTQNPGGSLPKPLLACERMALLVRVLCLLLRSIEVASILFDRQFCQVFSIRKNPKAKNTMPIPILVLLEVLIVIALSRLVG